MQQLETAILKVSFITQYRDTLIWYFCANKKRWENVKSFCFPELIHDVSIAAANFVQFLANSNIQSVESSALGSTVGCEEEAWQQSSTEVR